MASSAQASRGRGAFADNTECLRLSVVQLVSVPTSAVLFLFLSSLVAMAGLKRRKQAMILPELSGHLVK